MTAYGRATLTNSLGRFVAEIQSVNRKHLEINAVYPNRLVRYDGEIKKWVGAAVARGQVTIRLSLFSQETSPVAVVPNLPLARQLFHTWKAIGSDLHLVINDELVMTALQASPDVILFEEAPLDENLLLASLKEVVAEALKKLVAMKVVEGKALFDDIKGRLNKIVPIIKAIEEKAPGAAEKYRQKLQDRIKEVCGAGSEADERILREVCLYAEKIDISEEITRFASHISQAHHLLDSGASGVGKTFEFLLQELNREINTIGSKSSDLEVTRSVVEIKSELERIREQIQNVE